VGAAGGGYFWWKAKNRVVSLPARSGEKQPQVETIVRGLEVPWEIVFVSQDEWWVTERGGRIRVVKGGKLMEEPLLTIDEVAAVGEGGLLGMALDPDFASNGYVYIYYTYREGGQLYNKVVRMKYGERALGEVTTLIDKIPGATQHDGGRIRFGPDGYLYMATGDAGKPELAQDLGSLAGKILRIDPKDPQRVISYYETPVFGLGFRNPEGLAWDDKGKLYATDHGPRGRDEFNWVKSWENFGWPWVTGNEWEPSLMGPVIQSGAETWAPSGADYYRGSVFFAGLRGEAIYEVVLGETSEELKVHVKGEFGRLRTVKVGPDGNFYVLTSNRDGRGIAGEGDDRVIRIQPSFLGK